MIDRKRPKRASPDYEVGYGKPPKHTRFKPGRSGNTKGRPKGSRNFKTDVKATLKSPVNVNRDGKPRKITTQKAMLLRLKEKALNGDIRSLNLLMVLAQTYNNEDLPQHNDLSGDDMALLKIYNSRLLSGAVAGGPNAKPADQQCDDGSEARADAGSQPATDPPRRKRVTSIKRHRPRRDLENKGDGEV